MYTGRGCWVGRTNSETGEQLSRLRTSAFCERCSLGALYSGEHQSKPAAHDVIRPTAAQDRRHGATRICYRCDKHVVLFCVAPKLNTCLITRALRLHLTNQIIPVPWFGHFKQCAGERSSSSHALVVWCGSNMPRVSTLASESSNSYVYRKTMSRFERAPR